jgi:F0F1-type ATP synthase assembly protein I
MLGLRSKALRTVFWWQALATSVIAVAAALAAGVHGGISAVLGGSTAMVAGVAAGLLIQRGKAKTAPDMLIAAITAEAVRIGVMLAFLWLIFATYKQVVPGGLIGAFLVAVLIFSMAFFVRDNTQQPS